VKSRRLAAGHSKKEIRQMVKQRPTQADLWRREIDKIDRRIQNPRTTPEQRKELWEQRNKLFEPSEAERNSHMRQKA
jgi:hypothetical protein